MLAPAPVEILAPVRLCFGLPGAEDVAPRSILLRVRNSVGTSVPGTSADVPCKELRRHSTDFHGTPNDFRGLSIKELLHRGATLDIRGSPSSATEIKRSSVGLPRTSVVSWEVSSPQNLDPATSMFLPPFYGMFTIFKCNYYITAYSRAIMKAVRDSRGAKCDTH